MTRGERNNNPLNIRRTADKWLGMSQRQNDSDFIVFDSLEYGIRAALKLIRKYVQHFSCNTISKIISRWAPPCENDTKSYILYVAKKTEISESEFIKFDDREKICNIVKAMAQIESQMNIPIRVIQVVWDKYF